MTTSPGLVLVTGGTGFVGSHVVASLLDAGHRVRCTVRRTSDTRWLDGLDVELVEADVRRPEALAEAVRGTATVVHVAGITRAARPELFRRVNGEGTARLGKAATETGVRRFVYLSSLAARGPDGTEGPVSEYGASKREGEERLRGLAGGMEVTVLRPGGVYGPRDSDLLPLFRAAARGWLMAPSAGSVLQPVYVSDVAGAVLRALQSSPGFGPFPLAEERVYEWPAVADGMAAAFGHGVRLVTLPAGAFEAAGVLAQTAWRMVGRAPPLDRRRARDVARHRWTCDPGPTERALGWKAEVGLSEGLRRAAAWYREAGWL